MGLITVYVVFLQSRECINIDVRSLSHSEDVVFLKIWQTKFVMCFDIGSHTASFNIVIHLRQKSQSHLK